MKKFLVMLTAVLVILATGCGSSSNVTPEEFARRYNANLAEFKGLDYNKLKIGGFNFNEDTVVFYGKSSEPEQLMRELMNADFVLTAKIDPASKKIRQLNVGTNFMKTSKTFLVVYAIASHSLDSGEKISENEGVELIKFFQGLLPDKSGTNKKTFNGKTYSLTVDTSEGSARLTIDND